MLRVQFDVDKIQNARKSFGPDIMAFKIYCTIATLIHLNENFRKQTIFPLLS